MRAQELVIQRDLPHQPATGSRAILVVCLLLAFAAACGEPEQTRSPEIVVLTLERTTLHASAATDASVPVEIVLTLAGPDGARTERRLTAEGSLQLDELTPGHWSLNADGLDENGDIGWTAPRTTFAVEAGKQSKVQLHLEILP